MPSGAKLSRALRAHPRATYLAAYGTGWADGAELAEATARSLDVSDEIESRARHVLLHGDVSRRNLVRIGPARSLHLVDYERAAIGPAEHDLVRALHAEFFEPGDRIRFLDAYGEVASRPAPDPCHLWALSLVLGMGLSLYGLRNQRARPSAFGAEILDRCIRDVYFDGWST